MVIKTVAPYGDWESELSAEAVTEGSRHLTSPRADRKSGRAFFLESRPNGTTGIVEATADGQRHVLPDTSSASSTVYEYGGLPYALLPGHGERPFRIIFSDAADQSVGVLDVDSGHVRTLLRSTTLRYGDFDAHPLLAYQRGDDDAATSWVLAVEEDHADGRPAGVRNYVVAISLVTGEVRRVVLGADFYSYPRFNPDGRKVVWKEWDHPDLPFRGARLRWADWQSEEGGTLVGVENLELVAGGDGECPTEPRWSYLGTLLFAQEQSNFRQLFRRGPHDVEASPVVLKGLEDAEIGDASWLFGCQTYVFLDDTSIIAAPTWSGAYELIHINLRTSTCTRLKSPFTDLRLDCLAALSAYSVLAIGSGPTTPQAVYKIIITPDHTTHPTLIRSSVDQPYRPGIFSTPTHLRFPAPRRHRHHDNNGDAEGTYVHAFFWPPHNRRFVAPRGTLPPLLVTPHGGPTGHSTPGLRPGEQYFCARGYAVVAVNYAGSTAHGRRYREALFGGWGVLDRDDVVEVVRRLVEGGRVDGSRVGIVGSSAGGYNVLQGLCWYPEVFAGGVCYCGVADVRDLEERTHKLESRYVEVLLQTEGLSEEEKESLYRERSPLYHAQQIRAPLLLIHGEDDSVVPIEQSRRIQKRIEGRGGDVKLVTFPGEGHVFKKAKSALVSLQEADKWWRKTLLRKE